MDLEQVIMTFQIWRLLTENSDNDQNRSDHDVQNIVNSCPFEVLFGEEIGVTGNSLIKVNQTETDIECPDCAVVTGKYDYCADDAEQNVKDVVRSRSAGGTFTGRDDETQNAD